MKKNFYIIAAAFFTVFASSCKDDFLEKEPNQQFSPEQISRASDKDPSLLTGSINGLYATMYTAGSGGTTGHDDFGQKGFDIFSDMLVSDMVLGGVTYGWYSPIVRYQATTNNTQNNAYQPWRYYYRIILGANTVMDALGGQDAELTDPSRRHTMGQAKAMRAYAYFYLAQFYSTGYGDGTEKILPIYTDATMPNQPKSTAAEVYKLIIDDLTEAVVLLEDFNRSSKDQVNKNVAKGLLAYAYAARGTQEDLQKVVTLTDEVISTSGHTIMNASAATGTVNPATGVRDPAAGFNNVSNNSWMWGVDLTIANGLDLISWWGQIDLFTYSYAWAGDKKRIDKGLYDAIPVTDTRKAQFTTNATYNLMPINKFYAPARVIGGQRTIETDYVYMRIEEMYLLNAEANARLNQEAPAKDKLKALLAKRMVTAADYAYVDLLTGKALEDEIYLQTRIELWGEGKAYLAMKRNKRTITRGSNHVYDAGKSFAWDSDELTFPIPQAEVINNPVLNQ
ncbi:RagB/SusD family nutrient uptake outer membrane protein [Rufibacter hautae]|uniref:RagB/SusD family nutrient uptake outer membrane protein n=1 Tax=Rufibacter hautae TaxID=2595005 RepID=A0A5B6T842_9BACT|nr:RagB/SusD family nutrient uptake outer membrane protein [Rufibacter hautae]KAA3436145.1 RagB/SusD family nutrient uptake outer membrane protein [Rufibacter hautae]